MCDIQHFSFTVFKWESPHIKENLSIRKICHEATLKGAVSRRTSVNLDTLSAVRVS